MKAVFKEDAVTTLRLFINYFAPSAGVQTDGAHINFYLYNSATNDWKNPSHAPPVYSSAKVPVKPGGRREEFSIDLPLAQLWLSLAGQVRVSPGGQPTIFVAEPPDLLYPDADAFDFGPPWIALKDLAPGAGLAGNLWHINGPYTRVPDGSLYWQNNNRSLLGTWALKQVAGSGSAPMPPGGLSVSSDD